MNLGFSGEIIFILVLALVLFGPRRLPELARQAGRLMAEFRKASDSLQNQIQAEIGQLELEEIDPRKNLAPTMQETIRALDDGSAARTQDPRSDGITNLDLKAAALGPEDNATAVRESPAS